MSSTPWPPQEAHLDILVTPHSGEWTPSYALYGHTDDPGPGIDDRGEHSLIHLQRAPPRCQPASPTSAGTFSSGRVPWFPAVVEDWSVRRVVLFVIEESARLGGRADIIRESLDGAPSTR
ncbi:DinB family protein [Streptomyces sp. IBSBF 2807]|nr:DinB family protein [Streptomyces hilarionis]